MSNQSFEIRISQDKMRAFLTIDKESNSFPDHDEILAEMENQGISYGIKYDAIEKALEKDEEVKSLTIAEGDVPEKGKDAKLVWYIKSDHEYKPSIDNDGKADYWSHKKISQLEKGDEIVTKLPPTKGTPGKTVTGEQVIEKGKDINLPQGENVVVSDDGLTLRAEISGHLEYKNGKIVISRTYMINGDVDFSTGDIKYKGKVHISGDVRSGFKVEADDSIIVEGNVEAAHIYSRHGDIHVNLGIVGKGRANILAGGNLHCGYIQAAKVNVSKNIYIKHYAINSEIYAGNKILANKNEGLLRGGKIYSEEGVEAIQIGSEKHIATELGIDFNFPQFNAQIQKLSKTAKSKESELELVSKKIKFLNLLNERIDKLSDEKRGEYKELIYRAKNLKEELNSIQQQKENLLSRTDKDFKKKSIIIKDTIYQGVQINMGNLKFDLDQDYKKIKIFRDASNISIQKLS